MWVSRDMLFMISLGSIIQKSIEPAITGAYLLTPDLFVSRIFSSNYPPNNEEWLNIVWVLTCDSCRNVGSINSL